MHYVSAEGLSKSYGVKPLFQQITFHISLGDKIALVARNGSGKSTLLRILAGRETADEGSVWIHKDVAVAMFEQEPVFIEDKSILDNIFHHSHPVVDAIKAYESASEAGDAALLTELVARLDDLQAWDFDHKVRQILGKLNIHHLQQTVQTLSGGQRKRVALAKVLIDIGLERRNVLLIMDEPTNHLDVEMVEWLERYLNQERVTLLMVTHDRYFLDAACDEIWEMDGGKLYVYKGDYQDFLEKKALRLENEGASIDKARNQYRKELEWMRKQPKARTTKSKSRQDNFYQIEARAKQRIGDQQLDLQVRMSRLGGKVIELKKVYKSYDHRVILAGFDYTFKTGERLGIVGKNGVGKSTFLNILQGIESPDSGKVNIGETVIFGNYAQQGLTYKEDMRVIEFVKRIAEHFPLAGGGTLSAAQFLNLFLFPPDQQYTFLSRLSGGEKRRLHLLSILFRNPNFLILDEPTNDLDLPTLGVLENFLTEFQGCLVIVSHDRYFMDRLVDHLLVMDGDGRIRDFPGNYTQYRQSLKNEAPDQDAPRPDAGGSAGQATPAEAAEEPATVKKKAKLSYKEKRELESLNSEIAVLEEEKKRTDGQLQDGTTTYDELQRLSMRIGEIDRLLDEKEMRWLELNEVENG